MQKEDIKTNLLVHPEGGAHSGKSDALKSNCGGAAGAFLPQSREAQQHHISLADLPQYRVKNHCNYDLASISTEDYSVFQIEITDDTLKGHYSGTHILEIWNRQGQRIFQKVLQEEITQWKLYNNVFIFKPSSRASLIYIIFLQERKMAAIKHPYDDLNEVDMTYFENYLIVLQSHSVRFVQILPSDVSTYIEQFQTNGDYGGSSEQNSSPLIEKEFSGLLQPGGRIIGIVYNHLRNELISICTNESFQLSYYNLLVNRGNESRQLQLVKYEPDEKAGGKGKGGKQQERRQSKIDIVVPSEVQQLHYLAQDQVAYLIVLRKNQSIEVIRNFHETIFVEQRMNVARILPSFGDSLTFQFFDGSIATSPSFDRMTERNYLSDAEYYKHQMLPPKGTIQYDIHRSLHFYQDAVVVNQTLFLLRDNAIFLVNTHTKKIINTYFSQTGFEGSKILSLHKLRQQTEDENGFKVTTFKVVAVQKNGYLQIFVPADINLMTEWSKTEVTNTAMAQLRDPVHTCFQNQNASNYIYIVTVNNSNNSQRVFQMMFNTGIIEFTNLKLTKGDLVFSVNSVSRQRELLGIVDQKYLAIYRNDKGSLIKLYQINHTRYEIRDNINANSVFYFQREYATIIAKQWIYKINIATNAIDQARLVAPISDGGSAFIDAQCFYFIAGKGAKTNGKASQSLLACADTSMIEASFNDALKLETQSAIVDKDQKKGSNNELMHPTFSFGDHNIKRMDYDEFNAVLNLQMANLEIIQVPLFHRNTMHFIGMAERSFYLCFKKHGDYLFALDKQNYISKWYTVSGELVSRVYWFQADYRGFEVDRDLYDRNWFKFTLIYKNNDGMNALENSNSGLASVSQRTNKIIKINKAGNVVERLQFEHPAQRNENQHLYFNSTLDKMIELNISKQDSKSATYNEYKYENGTWAFVRTLNQSQNEVASFVEWHTKSLYPFPLNLKDFTSLAHGEFALRPLEDTYKVIKGGEKIKVLNTQDGIEIIIDTLKKEVDSYMALQYSFVNTKVSFYDKNCGQFFIQEVTSRLQNYYEYLRRQMLLRGKIEGTGPIHLKLRGVDVSARNFKHKYVIEQSFTQMDSMFVKQYLNIKDEKDKEKKMLRVFKKMSNDHLQRLVHNIFPKDEEVFGSSSEGNTVMHLLAKFNLGFECVDFIGKLSKKEGFVVPFLPNTSRETPLDLTVQRRDHKQTNSLVKLLQKAPMDHHSRYIAHLMPNLIEQNVPQLVKYFDRRRFQTGVCKGLNVMKIKINSDHDMKSVSTTLINDNKESVLQSLTHKKYPEQSVSLEVFDLPLNSEAIISKKMLEKEANQKQFNQYEVKLIKSLAVQDNNDLFQQKTVRAYVDFMWPIAKGRIIKNVFLPYMAFIIFYLLYLVVLKRLDQISKGDPQFYEFTYGMFSLYDILFKFVLFLGCFYFLFQDFQQMKSLPSNQIVLWSYANVVPLCFMIFVVVWDTLFTRAGEVSTHADNFQKTMYSITAFLVWVRVIHLLKCFTHTSYLLRMATEILFRIRWLIAFIVISLLSFGFTLFFVDESKKNEIDTPFEGVRQMFYVLLGNYDVNMFDNIYQGILLILVASFNAFFIFTLLISLAIISFSKGDSGVWSNEAYQDKASLIGLYSYLLYELPIRLPNRSYLLIATVTEGRKGGRKNLEGGQTQVGGVNSDPRVANAKMMKSIDRRLNTLSSKVERALKEIQEKVGGSSGAPQ